MGYLSTRRASWEAAFQQNAPSLQASQGRWVVGGTISPCSSPLCEKEKGDLTWLLSAPPSGSTLREKQGKTMTACGSGN